MPGDQAIEIESKKLRNQKEKMWNPRTAAAAATHQNTHPSDLSPIHARDDGSVIRSYFHP
jgi:hypothetical protein